MKQAEGFDQGKCKEQFLREDHVSRAVPGLLPYPEAFTRGQKKADVPGSQLTAMIRFYITEAGGWIQIPALAQPCAGTWLIAAILVLIPPACLSKSLSEMGRKATGKRKSRLPEKAKFPSDNAFPSEHAFPSPLSKSTLRTASISPRSVHRRYTKQNLGSKWLKEQSTDSSDAQADAISSPQLLKTQSDCTGEGWATRAHAKNHQY